MIEYDANDNVLKLEWNLSLPAIEGEMLPYVSVRPQILAVWEIKMRQTPLESSP